jgi:hypothetical protein
MKRRKLFGFTCLTATFCLCMGAAAMTIATNPDRPAPRSVTSAPTNRPNPIETKDPYVYLAEYSYLIFADHDISRGNGAGVKVYRGESKTLTFEIIGGGDCVSMPSGQGYLVRYPDGNEEWKDKRALENAELFVDEDTLKLFKRDWTLYSVC